MTTVDAVRAWVFAEADRIIAEEQRLQASWREGYAAAEAAHADDYSRGYHDGALARKHAQHDLRDLIELELLRWGPGGREHFADPRPDDDVGGPVAA